MNWTVQQSIAINQLRIDLVTNASVVQIGAAGSIKSLANLYNTGKFTDFGEEESGGAQSIVVPLPSPSA